MMRLIFTVYMLLLFIFSATAKDQVTNHRTVEQCVVAVRSSQSELHRKAHIRHKRLHRKNARIERKIRRSHRRHVVVHH
ncbi:MAG: hypothetical protein KI791_04225 [Cyclobacteriaceae bacterium]|nr:hypothetical protein [Cyclobacteriaceae bacterium SS2]